ncbi:flavin reductase family protein [Cryobacterium tepidiphilum]|uniref:Flavin reductase n=1 Tax=Cryobacterium tepidiphilum TaxID=2486026 RepID=A0A3M8KXC7_9MICO|nr:flavin reductase family protein [Cryobacterium tepidiphilum]RNE56994.1 flavin reductase [Cryobacterium tepidiphilum]
MEPLPGATSRTLDPSAVTTDDAELYKSISARAAKGVAVITTVHRGWDHAATVTDVLSVSYDPPTMVASIYGLSRLAEAIEESGRWGISLLSARQKGIAEQLGEPGSPLVGLLDQVPHFRTEPGAPPLLRDALAWFELRTVAEHPAATHTLFVGEVTWMGRPDQDPPPPLVRYQSAYHGAASRA